MATSVVDKQNAVREQKKKLDGLYKKAFGKGDSAGRHRDRMAARSREQYAAVSDIGELPPVVNSERKEACRLDLFAFLITYFPHTTGLSPFSEDHRRVIDRLQRCILEGGQFVNGVYRGFAKTTISENAGIWAILYGHRKFVMLLGAAQASANEIIDSIKNELEYNDLLAEDFPEVCRPIRALEGKNQRCASQTYRGQRTGIDWTAEQIVLPNIPDSPASGAVVRTKGIEGAQRGTKFKTQSGVQQRPDLVIVDDPQTDESANSPLQVNKRLRLIRGLPQLGGHRKKIAAVVNATVIAPDDVIDQLLTKPDHAAWQGERIPMVRKFSEAHELWLTKYRELRTTYDRDRPGDQARAHQTANAFYLENQGTLDAGCQVSWEHCYDHERELSAIQHAYNVLFDLGEDVFDAECQLAPKRVEHGTDSLKAEEICKKTNGLKRLIVPLSCDVLTAFIDVQKSKLYYVVCAWGPGFTGSVIDYGSWPDEKKSYFTLAGCRRTLEREYPSKGFEAQLNAGLGDLTDYLLDREWTREHDGAAMKIRRCLVDANWGDSTDIVYGFCRRSKHAALLMPSHGKFVGASSTPFAEYKRKPGDRVGHNWRVPCISGKKAGQHVTFDANYYKSHVHARLKVAIGDAGCLSLFDGKHQMLADHIVSEYGVEVTAKGRTIVEWRLQPSRPDNHFLDCLVGCSVAANMEGIHLGVGTGAPIVRRRRKGPKEAVYL